MKYMRILVFGLTIAAGLLACDKNEEFNAVGGELPTNYIRYRDSAFTPNVLDIANGSSITFLNQTSEPITIKGDDTTLLKTVLILPDSYYFFKPDTLPPTPVSISIPYHCVERPSSRGVIILRP